MLKYFVSFKIKEFNERLLNFGYSEKDMPVPILSTALKPDKALASQMLLLSGMDQFCLS